MEYSSIDDLLYAWLRQANEGRDRFRFPPVLLEESVSTIHQSFETEWMKNNVVAKEEGQPILAPLADKYRAYAALKYRYWKADEATLAGRYSEEFLGRLSPKLKKAFHAPNENRISGETCYLSVETLAANSR